MTITVTIHIQEGENQKEYIVVPSEEALADVRFKFNPSGLAEVEKLKLLAASFITEAKNAPIAEGAGREAAVARTEAQGACMWAVAGATKHL